MTTVFISYARGDAEVANQVSAVLHRNGLQVWMDARIAPGEYFDEAIERALNESDVVVVLWTSKSIASNWVREEAHIAQRLNKLVPVLIESVDPPVGFRRVQALDLREAGPNLQLTLERVLIPTLRGDFTKPQSAFPKRKKRKIGTTTVNPEPSSLASREDNRSNDEATPARLQAPISSASNAPRPVSEPTTPEVSEEFAPWETIEAATSFGIIIGIIGMLLFSPSTDEWYWKAVAGAFLGTLGGTVVGFGVYLLKKIIG